jgi:carboxyl-terminal processing protease
MARVIPEVDKLMLLANNKNKDGKGATVSGSNAPKFGQINLTMAKFYRINGSSTQHKGVMPDIQFPMVFPADKYGESSEPTALPWDTIKPSNYVTLANLEPVKRQLISKHEERMKNSVEFKNLKSDIEQFIKRDTETSVTLNETQLKKERDEQEARNLARENATRAVHGLPVRIKGEARTQDDIDFLRDESLQIMADYIQLKK